MHAEQREKEREAEACEDKRRMGCFGRPRTRG